MEREVMFEKRGVYILQHVGTKNCHVFRERGLPHSKNESRPGNFTFDK